MKSSKSIGAPHHEPKLRFSYLSAPRQLLLRCCQIVKYGSIESLQVKNAEPVFSPESRALVEVKLNMEDARLPEAGLVDFRLPDEMCRLMARLDEIQNGTITRIEVRAGIPHRLIFERRLSELQR